MPLFFPRKDERRETFIHIRYPPPYIKKFLGVLYILLICPFQMKSELKMLKSLVQLNLNPWLICVLTTNHFHKLVTCIQLQNKVLFITENKWEFKMIIKLEGSKKANVLHDIDKALIGSFNCITQFIPVLS